MADSSFVHLHVHSEYSMLDGAARQRESLARVHQMGQPALGITDHANVYGAFDLVKNAEAEGVKPIVGIEANLAPDSRLIKTPVPLRGVGEPSNYTHMTMWAENNEGMYNIFRLSSLSSIEGFYTKPRLDRELLYRYGKGIIATTGCLGGEVNQLLVGGHYKEALASAAEFKDIFGAGNFFAEVMDHGIQEERRILPDLLKIAKTLDLPLVATNDAHYTFPEQQESHDALLCVNTGAHVSDPKRFRFDGEGYYLKSSAEMRDLWYEHPDACDNTLLIAERCNVSFESRRDLMPKFPIPEGCTEESYFREQVWKGINERYAFVTEEIRERAEYEMKVIIDKQYPSYFLITSDFIRWGKNKGIRFGPARGSAGGSLVAYALHITELDPILHKLMFERFLNPDRPSMPDIDIDIQEDRRGEVIEYVVNKYGEDKVSQIITFAGMKGKSNIKDAARVLGYPVALSDKLSKAYPKPHQGKDVQMDAIFVPEHKHYKEAVEIRKIYESDPDAKKVLDLARQWEGLKRQTGVHAAGVMMCSQPLFDVLPLMQTKSPDKDKDHTIITQFEYPVCETLGVLKMDFLGLRNLTVMQNCLDHIKRIYDIDIVLEDLPLDDEKTFRLFAKGDTLGVFQLDGAEMRNLLRRMKPTSFEDISAVLALYRPGPMGVNAHNDYADRKNGRQEVDYIHEELTDALKPILEETHGLIVYQEQVMMIAQTLAGYSMAEADLLRRAMGKKKKEELDKIEPEFRARMLERGYSAQSFQALWDTILPFSDYAFNKAHTAGYGLVSYWTGYLKAHYPVEYMAALLSSTHDKPELTTAYLSECRQMQIPVLPPDINESGYGYTPSENGEILFGLGAIKGIGEGPAEAIQKGRQSGPYRSLTDFFFRTGLMKRSVEPLILSGALDKLGYTRAGIWESFAPILNMARVRREEHLAGIRDLFSLLNESDDDVIDITDPPIPNDEWDELEQLNKEHAVIGIYLSGHPLNNYRRSIEQSSTVDALDVLELHDGSEVIIGGILGNVDHRISKRGNPWVMMNLIGVDAVFSMRCFDKDVINRRRELFENGQIVMVKARVQVDENQESRSLIVNGIKPVNVKDAELEELAPIVLNVSKSSLTKENADKLMHLMKANRGHHKMVLNVQETGKEIILDGKVNPSDTLKRRLLGMFGTSCIQSGLGE